MGLDSASQELWSEALREGLPASCGSSLSGADFAVLRAAPQSNGYAVALIQAKHKGHEHRLLAQAVTHDGTWNLDRASTLEPWDGLFPPVVNPGLSLAIGGFVGDLVRLVRAWRAGDNKSIDAVVDGGAFVLFIECKGSQAKSPVVVELIDDHGKQLTRLRYWLDGQSHNDPEQPSDYGISTIQT